MNKQRVLFICIHNSARSQMAEAFLKEMAGDRFEVESAGLEPGTLNPFVVEAMGECGIDISQNKTQSVFELFKAGRKFQYVIAVCDKEASERCPIFPSLKEKLHWPFPDPSGAQGSDEEKLAAARSVRDQVQAKVAEWVAQIRAQE
jgi:arsenate reductase (thioredoxin)